MEKGRWAVSGERRRVFESLERGSRGGIGEMGWDGEGGRYKVSQGRGGG